MPSNNFNNIPYAQWLEKTIQDIIKLPIKGICLSAILEGGAVYTAYHNVVMIDKLAIAGIVQQDAMRDTLAANGDSDDEEK